MKKSRLLLLAFLLIVIAAVLIIGVPNLMSPSSNNGGTNNGGSDGGDGSSLPEDGSPYLTISKALYCSTDEGDAVFSKNPPYFLGEKYYFWVEIEVQAKADVRDVVISDSFAAELMVEGVSYAPIEKPGPYNYTLDYSDGYAVGAEISVSNGTYVWSGFLGGNGISFEEFALEWSGFSLGAEFRWNVGSMISGEVKTVYVTVSTDVNTGGLQEFAGDGVHMLDSGITVIGIVESSGKLVGVKSESFEIMVYEKVE